ncbi:MAG: ABC transporter ATP-binding protein [Chlorobiaceae bacterium]|nr:ABC transporter ATP-binding protein [Chlorobiaceae bacterium]MBA4309047.1 ABC transporter ATP-binding protein [Chlorobiaceae bacterium]
MINNPIALNVKSIKKQFAIVTAVKDLSFQIRRGEIFALLGPNGAGKTTTVRMLLDFFKPDKGVIEYFLSDNQLPQKPSPSEIGYLPEERGLYLEMPIIKTLTYLGVIRGIEKKDVLNGVEHWLKKLDLYERRNEKLINLSKGNQQKIQFIAAILHKPLFLILDEPFSGFDPINQEIFLSLIKELQMNGTTILLSAHQMHLVERVADRVLLMNNGKMIAYGDLDSIRSEHYAEEKLIVTLNEKPDLEILKQNPSIKKIELLNEAQIEFYLKRKDAISELLNKISLIHTILSIKTEQISLHDIFIEKVKNDKERNHSNA